MRQRNGMVSLIDGAEPIFTEQISSALMNQLLLNIEPNPNATSVVVLHVPVKRVHMNKILRLIRDAEEL